MHVFNLLLNLHYRGALRTNVIDLFILIVIKIRGVLGERTYLVALVVKRGASSGS